MANVADAVEIPQMTEATDEKKKKNRGSPGLVYCQNCGQSRMAEVGTGGKCGNPDCHTESPRWGPEPPEVTIYDIPPD